jgi:serine/threonine protein phosphatase PrpC
MAAMVTTSPGTEREATPIPDTLRHRDKASLDVHSFGVTDKGRERSSNEDQFLIARLTGAVGIQQSSIPQSTAFVCGGEQGHLFVVADGMGGAAGGERASSLAVGSIERFALGALKWLLTLGGAGQVDLLAELKTALTQADARICAEAAEHPELHGMGTTVTLAYSFGSQLFIAHVGDSRAYLLRGGRLYRLTQDHTLVEQMIAQGVLTPRRAANHQLRHVVTNIVGGSNPGVTTELHKIDLAPGDRLLLCTDGLSEMSSDDRIAKILAGAPGPRAAAEALTREANEQGGRDNVTAIVADYR